MTETKKTGRPQGSKDSKPRAATKATQRTLERITQTEDTPEYIPTDQEAQAIGQSKNAITGMTYKQEHFARLVSEGTTLTQAYTKAFDVSGMSDDSIRTRASHLAKLEHVRARINALIVLKGASVEHTPEQIKNAALDYLINTVANPNAKDADRLKAAELLGRVKGVSLFADKTTDKPESNTDKSALNTLDQRLRALIKEKGEENQMPQEIAPISTDSALAKAKPH